jgi:hypothetical protein
MPALEQDLSNPELVAEICARLSAGETTRAICRSYNSKIERQFWVKMSSDQSFAATIAQARLAGQDALTAETIDIADEATEETVQSAKLRIWARQWYASKLAPKKYGEKVEHTGKVDSDVTYSWKGSSPKV